MTATRPSQPEQSQTILADNTSPSADPAMEKLADENRQLHAEVARLAATLDEIFGSSVWRFLAPLRTFGRTRQRIGKLWRSLPSMSRRAGGWRPLFRRATQVWRHDGLAQLVALAQNHVASTASAPDKPELEAMPHPGPKSNGRPEILFVSHEASRTGAPVFLLNLIDQLSSTLDADFIILLCAGGELKPEFKKLGTTLTLSRRDDVDPAVLNWLKQRNIQLVYSNTITNGMVQKRLKELGCPIICHVHELAYSIDRFFNQESIRYALETTSQFLAGSRAVADYLIHERGLPAAKVTLAYPFVDAEQNRMVAAASQPPLELPKDALVIGACGTIGWRKGSDLFVQVARLALTQSPLPLVFVWVGGPSSSPEFQQLQYEVEMLGLAASIRFTGGVKAHLPYLAQFDLFLLPSREDPFPLVALDAASLGIPTICFERAGGTPELVETDAGIVVPYLDIERMAEAIIRLANRPDERKQLGERGRNKVSERHDASVSRRHIRDIIANHLSQQPQESEREVSR